MAHLVKAINTSLPAFKGFDITIGTISRPRIIINEMKLYPGILSAGPLLMLTLYLTMLTTEDFVPVLPIKLQRVTKYILFLLIPLIILLNALGSFFNLQYSEC